MRHPGYQEDAPCWCSLHNRPYYSCVIVMTSLVLALSCAALAYGGYYIYTNRDSWIQSYNESQSEASPRNEWHIYEEDLPESTEENARDSIQQDDVDTKSRWPPVSDDEIKEISRNLWLLDKESQIPSSMYAINEQGKVNQTNTIDVSPYGLFSRMDTELLSWSGTFNKFIPLLDNYDHKVKETEELSLLEKQEIENFLDVLLSTRVMQAAFGFLIKKAFVNEDMAEFRLKLKEIWFELYSRSPKYNNTDSSGFEHVFVGETRGKVTGFHSWIQFYLQEQAGAVNYYGYHYYNKDEPWLINLQFSWHDKFKKETSFFLGTNPEFDIAIYTICIIVRTNQPCVLDINGLSPTVQSYDIRHVPGLQVGTAFLEV